MTFLYITSSSELAFSLSAKTEALTLEAAGIDKQYLLHYKIDLFEGLSFLGGGRDFLRTDVGVSRSVGSQALWLDLALLRCASAVILQ